VLILKSAQEEYAVICLVTAICTKDDSSRGFLLNKENRDSGLSQNSMELGRAADILGSCDRYNAIRDSLNHYAVAITYIQHIREYFFGQKLRKHIMKR
jgi:hypothetical protein